MNAKSKRTSVGLSNCSYRFIHSLFCIMNTKKVSVIAFLENWYNSELAMLKVVRSSTIISLMICAILHN